MLVSAGLQAYTLADIENVKATFGVPDSVAVQMKPGTPVSITIEALPDQRFDGKVSAIAAVADQDTRLYQVEVTLRNEKKTLRPGMIASLSLGGNRQGSSAACRSLERRHPRPPGRLELCGDDRGKQRGA